MKRAIFSFSLALFFLLLLCTARVQAQTPYFQKLGIGDGLDATGFSHIVIDQDGFFWIASLNGLFFYNGYEVTQYTSESHPALRGNSIGFLFCDSANRIWIQTNNGLAMMDEHRQLHAIDIPGYLNETMIDWIAIQAPGGVGYVAINASGVFISKNGITGWQPYAWLNSVLKNDAVLGVSPFDENSLIVSVRSKRVLLLNFKTQTVLMDLAVPYALGICKWNDEEILIGKDEQWGLMRVNIQTKAIVKEYPPMPDRKSGQVVSGLMFMKKAIDGNIYITTRRNGLVRLDPRTDQLELIQHDVLNNQAITSNNLKQLATDKRGMLAVTTANEVNYANLNYPSVGNNTKFLSNDGQVISDPILSVSSRGESVYFISVNHLLKWDRQSEMTSKQESNTNLAPDRLPFRSSIWVDEQQNTWEGFTQQGLIIRSRTGSLLKHIVFGEENPMNFIRAIQSLPDGDKQYLKYS